MAKDDANKQDMSVLDVEHAALAPTHEAQDTSKLNKIVVGMPSFTNPNNPDTAAGSVNFDVDEHPVEHSADYGAAVSPGVDEVKSTQDVHGREAAGAKSTGHTGGSAGGNGDGDADATEAAAKLAKENDVDLAEVTGTGADGRVTKDDVQAFINDRNKQ